MNSRILFSIALIFALVTTVIHSITAQAQQPANTTYQVYLPMITIPGSATPVSNRPQPNPAAITVATNASLAASADIGPEGGSVAAAGADGSTYLLTIPPAALTYTETLTLTPAQTNGLPFAAGDLGSVLIEPAGLTLLLPATLTISPADGNATLTAYTFESDGAEMHLYPVDGATGQGIAATGSATMKPQVLRGYGVTSASAAEVTAQANRAPTRFSDWLEQEIARSPGLELDVPLDYIKQYLNTELTPSNDLARLERIIAEFARIDRLLLAHADSVSSAYLAMFGYPKFQQLVNSAAASAHQVCVSQLRPSEGMRIARFISYLRKVIPDAPIEALQTGLTKCLTYELTFNSTLTEQSAELTRSATVEATIQLQSDGTTTRMTGNAVSQITQTSWAGAKPCAPVTIQKGSSIFWAEDDGLGLRLAPGRNGAGTAELLYSPGVDLNAIYTYHCPTPEGGIIDIPMVIPWAAYYDLMHMQDRVTINQLNYRMKSQGVDIDRFTGWVYQDSQDLGDVTVTENTQFELTHKPQP